jgi:hypothetical protein
MVLVAFNVIVSLGMTAFGVVMLVRGANLGFMVAWFAMLLVITVANVRQQVQRRRAARHLGGHADSRHSPGPYS